MVGRALLCDIFRRRIGVGSSTQRRISVGGGGVGRIGGSSCIVSRIGGIGGSSVFGGVGSSRIFLGRAGLKREGEASDSDCCNEFAHKIPLILVPRLGTLDEMQSFQKRFESRLFAQRLEERIDEQVNEPGILCRGRLF